MKKYVRIPTLFILLAVLLSGVTTLSAQSSIHYNAALLFVQNGQPDSAKIEMDLQMLEPGATKDPDNWYLQGVVYKELYKKYEVSNYFSPYRIKAVECFKTSLSMDSVPEHNKVTRDNLRFIANRYYNNAVATLDTINYTTSVACYKLYREAILLADPAIDIKKNDNTYYLALATTYATIYNKDKKANAKFNDLEKETYMLILSWDPDNYTANYNLGLLYWNKGVDMMYDIDYEINLDSVMDVQNHSVELFKEAKPFAEKAYEIAPKREETLVVLSGIYYSLNDFQKSKAYQQMLDDLRKQNPGK